MQQQREHLRSKSGKGRLLAHSIRMDIVTYGHQPKHEHEASARSPEHEASEQSPKTDSFGVGSNEDRLPGSGLDQIEDGPSTQHVAAKTLIRRPSAGDPPSRARARGASEGSQGSKRLQPSASQPPALNSLLNLSLSQRHASDFAAGMRNCGAGGGGKGSGQVPMRDHDDDDV